MAIKPKITIGVLLLHLLTCNMTCHEKCTNQDFSFAITNRIYPDKDTIQTGDTIWIEVDVPTLLTDLRSNTEIDYSGAVNLGSAIQFLKLGKAQGSDIPVTEAAQSFKTALVIGESIDNSQTPFAKKAKEFRFKEMNARYRFKAGFIPKEKGDFMISVGDAAGVYRHSEKCSNGGFTITIANTMQHLYLYQQSRADDYELSPYERTHVYCMRVK